MCHNGLYYPGNPGPRWYKPRDARGSIISQRDMVLVSGRSKGVYRVTKVEETNGGFNITFKLNEGKEEFVVFTKPSEGIPNVYALKKNCND